MTRLFISHSLADRDFVGRLRANLGEMGAEVIQESETVSVGRSWADQVTAQLKRADGVILVVPRAGSKGANNAFFELGVARALGKPVLAVVPDQEAARNQDLPTELVDVAIMQPSPQKLAAFTEAFVQGLKSAA